MPFCNRAGNQAHLTILPVEIHGKICFCLLRTVRHNLFFNHKVFKIINLQKFPDAENAVAFKRREGGEEMHYTKQDIIHFVEEEDVEFIRLQFTDMFGNFKNMAVTTSQLEKVLGNECVFNGSAIEGFMSMQEPDIYLYPDLGQLCAPPSGMSSDYPPWQAPPHVGNQSRAAPAHWHGRKLLSQNPSPQVS